MGLGPVRLPGDLLSRGAVRLPADDYYGLWSAIDSELPAGTMPVRVAEAISTGLFDAAIFAAVCAPDLNGAAQRLARYKPLVGRLRLRVEISPHHTSIAVDWSAVEPPPPALAWTEPADATPRASAPKSRPAVTVTN